MYVYMQHHYTCGMHLLNLRDDFDTELGGLVKVVHKYRHESHHIER